MHSLLLLSGCSRSQVACRGHGVSDVHAAWVWVRKPQETLFCVRHRFMCGVCLEGGGRFTLWHAQLGAVPARGLSADAAARQPRPGQRERLQPFVDGPWAFARSLAVGRLLLLLLASLVEPPSSPSRLTPSRRNPHTTTPVLPSQPSTIMHPHPPHPPHPPSPVTRIPCSQPQPQPPLQLLS